MCNTRILVLLQYILFLEYIVCINISQQDNIIVISNEDGSIQCDKIDCPATKTMKCVVVRDSLPHDVNTIEIIDQCLDRRGRVFQEQKRKETNPYPGEVMRSRMEVMANGPIHEINGGQRALSTFTPALLTLIVSVVSLTGNILHHLF